MSTRTNRNPETLKVTDHLKRMGAADFRSLVPGHPEGPTLRELGEYPGVPCGAEISRQRNGHTPDPLTRLYCYLFGLSDLGATKGHLRKAEVGVSNAIAVITSDDPNEGLRDVIHRAQEVDLAEDQIEARVHAEGMSLGSLLAWRDYLRDQEIHTKQVRARVSREIRARRSA